MFADAHMTTYRALVDLVVAGKGVKAGATFETSDEQAAPAIAFGLAEAVASRSSGDDRDRDEPKPRAKRSTRKAS